MTLRDLIARLESEDPRKVCPLGIGDAFPPPAGMTSAPYFGRARNVTVGSMLASAQWVAAEFVTWLDQPCFFRPPIEDIGPTLLDLMLAAGTVPGEEIEGWTFDFKGGAADARQSDGWPIVRFAGARFEIETGGAPFSIVPPIVFDRLRAMWRDRNGA